MKKDTPHVGLLWLEWIIRAVILFWVLYLMTIPFGLWKEPVKDLERTMGYYNEGLIGYNTVLAVIVGDFMMKLALEMIITAVTVFVWWYPNMFLQYIFGLIWLKWVLKEHRIHPALHGLYRIEDDPTGLERLMFKNKI